MNNANWSRPLNGSGEMLRAEALERQTSINALHALRARLSAVAIDGGAETLSQPLNVENAKRMRALRCGMFSAVWRSS